MVEKQEKIVIVTTDFSEHARAAYVETEKEAKARGAKVVILTVITGFSVPIDIVGCEQMTLIESLKGEIITKTSAALKNEEKYFTQVPVESVPLLSVVQSAAEVVCEYARNKKSEVIVIASQGANALTEFMLGSVVHSILKRSSCPVLVVPVKR